MCLDRHIAFWQSSGKSARVGAGRPVGRHKAKRTKWHRIVLSGFLVERLSGGVLEADQATKPLDLGEPLMAETTLVVVERVNNYFLRAAVRVIRR